MSGKTANLSSALSIAAVTAVLKDLLENQLARQGAVTRIGDVSVSVTSPDRVVAGADERAALNLFLYRVTPNTSWRGAERPSLALNLHYLLSAYGEQELQIETLLGHAIEAFHAVPVLAGADLTRALETAAERASGAAVQTRAALAEVARSGALERIAIEPEFASMEELGRLWSALQARFRPSVGYRVSAIPVASQGSGR